MNSLLLAESINVVLPEIGDGYSLPDGLMAAVVLVLLAAAGALLMAAIFAWVEHVPIGESVTRTLAFVTVTVGLAWLFTNVELESQKKAAWYKEVSDIVEDRNVVAQLQDANLYKTVKSDKVETLTLYSEVTQQELTATVDGRALTYTLSTPSSTKTVDEAVISAVRALCLGAASDAAIMEGACSELLATTNKPSTPQPAP